MQKKKKNYYYFQSTRQGLLFECIKWGYHGHLYFCIISTEFLIAFYAKKHPPLSLARVKNMWSYTSTNPYAFIVWCVIKHKDNFTFVLVIPEAILVLE
jgi:hypothetical protein